MTAMRIAIAGSGGLAQQIAYFLSETSHLFIILSRAPKPNLEVLGYQVVVVNYEDQTGLRFALRGHDLVISTITGVPQINLIDAASHARIQRFVPAEFEGLPSRRPCGSPFDDGRAAALARLRDIAAGRGHRPMQFTSFVCGIFYERFAPGGLANKQLALGRGWEHQGAFLLDIGRGVGEVIEKDSTKQECKMCMTSLSDVAYFLVEALELGLDRWPDEFRMKGVRRSVTQIISYAETLRNSAFNLIVYTPNELAYALQAAIDSYDSARAMKLQLLTAVAGRQYDFSSTNLNEAVDYEPEVFEDWLRRHWRP